MRYLLLILILIAGTCQADQAGMVTAKRGDVLQNDTLVEQGGLVFEGDTIITAQRSFVVMQMNDGGTLTVRPDSTVVIDSYQEDEANIDLIQGGLRIVTGLIAKSNPDNYTVSTPVALMGVRGTEFSIMLCGDTVCEVEAE